MVIGEYFTKWKEAFAIENHTALTVADRLVNEFICKYGCPEQIHTDQGREFESDLFKTVCHKQGVHKTRTTPYRPQYDGMVERFNRTLKQMLSIFTNENPQDWDDLLLLLMMAYRATEHKSTGCSPNLMMFGRENSFPIDLMAGLPPDMKDEMCEIQYVEWLKQSMENVFQFARDKLGSAAKRQKRNYDAHSKSRQITQGEWVWRWYPPEANKKLGLVFSCGRCVQVRL